MPLGYWITFGKMLIALVIIFLSAILTKNPWIIGAILVVTISAIGEIPDR